MTYAGRGRACPTRLSLPNQRQTTHFGPEKLLYNSARPLGSVRLSWQTDCSPSQARWISRRVMCAFAQPARPTSTRNAVTTAAIDTKTEYLRALPGDDVRQILWRFADRFDLQMLVQFVWAVARGPVARLVAAGARNTH